MYAVPPQTITSPSILTDVIRRLKAAVSSGALVQVLPDPAPLALRDRIATVPDDGPWPDYLEVRFTECETGAQFRLSVETYHGAGGSWDLE